MALYPTIQAQISELDIHTVHEERKQLLQPLIDYTRQKLENKKEVRINFICTHNSRRSHLAQVWGQAIAHHLGISNVTTYSGGTEATALFPIAAETLQNAGFKIEQLSEGVNPIYAIKYAENEHPVIGFSKKLDDDFNPKAEFVAIMTCDQAAEACPFVAGAEQRIPITYLDPKAYDNTPQQAEKYQERSLQIATELLYILKNAL